MKYALKVKEFYIVKTELTRNRTHQSYRWKEIALSDDKKQLEQQGRALHPMVEWKVEER